MVKQYRKRPVIIEAIQLTKENFADVLTFCNNAGNIIASNENNMGVSISTLEGTMLADIGDYVIRGIKGEYYPCKPDIFERTYEEVDG